MADTAPLDLDALRRAVRDGTVAYRMVARLLLAGGPEDKIFQPTFAVENRASTRYAFEDRRIDGQAVPCVLLDSIASRANRMEEALSGVG